MKDRPILFSGPMVRAILEGRKTQTRRLVKPQPIPFGLDNRPWMPVGGVHQDRWLCPLGKPGDRLWVRETWQFCDYDGPGGYPTTDAVYRADGETDDKRKGWRPSIHMPRWASRITLEIVRVWVERVQDITEEDAKKEGVDWESHVVDEESGNLEPYEEASDGFRRLWQSLYGTWDANPWVWAIEFRRTR